MTVHLRKTEAKYDCAFFDKGTIIRSIDIDGLHFDPEDHALLGNAVAEIVNKTWRMQNV